MPLRAAGQDLFTVTDVARRWGISPEAVSRHHVEVGGLRARLVGRSKIVTSGDLQTYERRLRKALRAKIKHLEAWIARLDEPLVDRTDTTENDAASSSEE